MAAPTSFTITVNSTNPGSGSYQGAKVWTVTAPWGWFVHPDCSIAIQRLVQKDCGKMAAYLTDSSKTSANEVPL